MAAHEGSNIADTDTNAGTSGGQFVSPAGGAAITVDEQSAEDEPKSEGLSRRQRFLNVLLFKSLRKRLFPACRRAKKDCVSGSGVGRKVKSTSDVLKAQRDEQAGGIHFNNKISTSADSIFTIERGRHGLGSIDSLEQSVDGMEESHLEEAFFKGKWSSSISRNAAGGSGEPLAKLDLDSVGGATNLDTTAARHKMALRHTRKRPSNMRQRVSSPKQSSVGREMPESLSMPTLDEAETSQLKTNDVLEPILDDNGENRSKVDESKVDGSKVDESPRSGVILRQAAQPVATTGVTMRTESVHHDPTKRQTIATERTIFGERKVNRPSSVHDAPVSRDWDALGQPAAAAAAAKGSGGEGGGASGAATRGSSEFAQMFSRFKHGSSQRREGASEDTGEDKVEDKVEKSMPSVVQPKKEAADEKTKAVKFGNISDNDSSTSPQGTPLYKRASPLIKDRSRSQTVPRSPLLTHAAEEKTAVRRSSSQRVAPHSDQLTPASFTANRSPLIGVKKLLAERTPTTILIEKKDVSKHSPEGIVEPVVGSARLAAELTKSGVSRRPPQLDAPKPLVSLVPKASSERTPHTIVIEKNKSPVLMPKQTVAAPTPSAAVWKPPVKTALLVEKNKLPDITPKHASEMEASAKASAIHKTSEDVAPTSFIIPKKKSPEIEQAKKTDQSALSSTTAVVEKRKSAEVSAPLVSVVEKRKSAEVSATPAPVVEKRKSAEVSATPVPVVEKRKSAEVSATPVPVVEKRKSAEVSATPASVVEKKESAEVPAPVVSPVPLRSSRRPGPDVAPSESADRAVPAWVAMARKKTKNFEETEGNKVPPGGDSETTENTDKQPDTAIVRRDLCGTAPAANRKSKVMDLVKNWQNLQVS